MSYEWKWSTGEAYMKSARKSQIKDTHYDSRINAINLSLEDELVTDLRNQTSNHEPLSKREAIDNKMSDREMLSQRGVNPFMQTSYVNDVVARDMFLKPINTNFDKEN